MRTDNYAAMKQRAQYMLSDLGAPESEYRKASAHLVGKHVQWHFGEPSCIQPEWVLQGDLMEGKAKDAYVNAKDDSGNEHKLLRAECSTKIEWYAGWLGVLNALLEAQPKTDAWWLFREKANWFHERINELESHKRAGRRAGAKSGGVRRSGLPNILRRAVEYTGGYDLHKVMAYLSADIDAAVIELDKVSGELTYLDRNDKVRVAKAKTIDNNLRELRKASR